MSRHEKKIHDSGVFLSSDSGSSGDDGFNVEDLPIRGPKREILSLMRTPEKVVEMQGDEKAARVIFECLESNNQVVDIS